MRSRINQSKCETLFHDGVLLPQVILQHVPMEDLRNAHCPETMYISALYILYIAWVTTTTTTTTSTTTVFCDF
jgi:hypothetical protein